ncbi:ATP-binding protein [Gilvimarinus sp. SDUM040013]|uniref:histidine kinase n=1 Tax=Gilvimarinus gilvus TaxID=3058038 RepID=A0ABU4RVR0_9GAMM|nr:ATP-binding protein [Gilvimarinus sp. SDUM040013]MDO3387895.1 ATP-binding protein [Gilvimarinus sp. SDUM040013]MDX6848734.1 ATP-binding protein [Gilvimarinus sp. SDUM040013]
MNRTVSTIAHALKIGGIKTPLVICIVFLVLITSFVVALNRYWSNSLQPRLYRTAETQATILAESQANLLQQSLSLALASGQPNHLNDTVQEILLVEDPAIGQSIVEGLTLELDYQTVEAQSGSLDFIEGNTACASCFHASIPLFTTNGELIGIADFKLSDAYFQDLSQEMKSKLMAESSVALALMVVVWLTMLVMFYRLNAAKQVIEDSDRAKTRFMANVTHELRTPLNAILGYTQLYKEDGALMKTHRQGIETIDRSADHLLLMINDILDFSRTNQDTITLTAVETSFIHFLKTICDMAQAHARPKGIEFVCEVPERLPTAVHADEKRLRQVLLNLIGNAIKFTEKGRVTLRVELLKTGNDSADLRFSIRDTGIGISTSDLAMIFVPFVQVDNDITRSEGSGLGLTISQRILQLMNAKLKVSSTPDQGSDFFFNLHLATAQGLAASNAAMFNPSAKQSSRVNAPPTEKIEALIELAQKHNILALRKAVEKLEIDEHYQGFAEELKPYLQNYRFKPLVEHLTKKLA